MRIDPAIETSREFARSAAYRREQVRFFKEVEQRREQDRAVDQIDGEAADLAATMVMATGDEIADFQNELVAYRTATTEALIRNERELVDVRRQIDDMLSRAYVLPDGRRVFKTNDGLRVFDEHGVELNVDDIDPDAIEEWRPRAEPYLDRRAVESGLVQEQDQLVKFEDRLGQAEERAASSEMTRDELEGLRDELENTVPLSVRREMPGFEEPAVAKVSQDFGKAASGLPAETIKLDLPVFSR